jgi:NAD+ synthase (glutamine-hydrolysing)
MGVEICQDAWEGDKRPAHALAKRGVSLVVNPTASHFSFGKSKVRQNLTREGSRIIDGVYVFANLLGNESGRVIFDGDAYVAKQGEVICQTNRFSLNNHELIYASVELKSVNDAGDDMISLPAMEEAQGVSQRFVAANWESSEYIKEEEFARAVSLGLWDYVRKSNSYAFRRRRFIRDCFIMLFSISFSRTAAWLGRDEKAFDIHPMDGFYAKFKSICQAFHSYFISRYSQFFQ